MNRKIVKCIKKVLGLNSYEELELRTIQYHYRLKYGPYLFKKKYTSEDLINTMKDMGMKRGSNVFIHSKWDEMYNYIGNEIDFINAILEVIGEEGTLIMPAFPLKRKNKLFNVRTSVTSAGLLAEAFRKYPGVKRSENIQHSVCAYGPQADSLLSEHNKGDNPWDEKSPYYKLASLNTLVFSVGLRKYYIGTMVHCVEGVLMKKIDYYRSFFEADKTCHEYYDSEGNLKSYYSYDLNYNDRRRVSKHFGAHIMTLKYFDKSCCEFRKLSNLRISMYKADYVIPRMIELGKRGIDIYKRPSKRGYCFEK